MSHFNEYVISLVKLTIPLKMVPTKVTLSAVQPHEEIYIQQERNTKNNNILNLYREEIFLASNPETLAFKIY